MAGICLHNSENSASIKDEEFFGQLRNYWLRKMHSSPWNELCRILLMMEK
jgi:hypothetical protein